MSDFVNTIDLLGDEAVMDSIIDRSITEFKDNVITTIGAYAFRSCTALTEVDLSNVVSLGDNCFGSTGIESIKLSKPTTIPYRCFKGCTNLITVDLESATSLSIQAFNICSALKTLILRASSVVTLGNNVFQDSSITTCYIYVPSSLVESYKASTSWSAYSDNIRALEDYTVDGTITGELDESKI